MFKMKWTNLIPYYTGMHLTVITSNLFCEDFAYIKSYMSKQVGLAASCGWWTSNPAHIQV